MNRTIKPSVALGLFLLLVFSGRELSAQKTAHLNFGNLLAMMPETKQADTELENYRKSLTAKGEKMADSLNKKHATYTANVENGALTPSQQQEKMKEMNEDKTEIIEYEREMNDLIKLKRQELLTPILDKVERAIEAVAKENGYEAVLDTSVLNAVLFAAESEDLMPLMKSRLGISE